MKRPRGQRRRTLGVASFMGVTWALGVVYFRSFLVNIDLVVLNTVVLFRKKLDQEFSETTFLG